MSGVDCRPPGLHVGRDFMLAGVQHYLTPCCIRHDAGSATFAADMYHPHLLQGTSLGDALAAARAQADQAMKADALLWTRFIHYGNPAFQLPLP
ncbi:MAG: hypothetical protein O7G88_14300 [bacterium]|nr:hypothetical protein [bacterium]